MKALMSFFTTFYLYSDFLNYEGQFIQNSEE